MQDFLEGASPATSGSSTDISEDSVEVRVLPIKRPSCLTNTLVANSSSTSMASSSTMAVRRHKRKSAEPRKLKDTIGPKRPKWEEEDEDRVASAPTATTTYFDVSDEEEEEEEGEDPRCRMAFYDALTTWSSTSRARSSGAMGPPPRTSSAASTSRTDSEEAASTSADVDDDGDDPFQKPKSYKNMTRERRMEANARERTRVHTISAAFESLRRAVPSYSCHQKLSKLAILRIACSYILALAKLNDMDYSEQQDNPSFGECVDLCTRTIQAEGRTRKRKD